MEFFSSMKHMGFPTLSQKQIEFCEAALPKDPKKTFDNASRLYDILVGLCGKGCIAGDEEVRLADGRVLTVEELSRGDVVAPYFCLDKSNKRTVGLGTRFFKKGKDDLYRVTTNYGKTCRVTLDHKFLTSSGWRALKNIKTGDFIAGPGRIDINPSESVPLNEARLIGYWVGGGKSRHLFETSTSKSRIKKLNKKYGLLKDNKRIPEVFFRSTKESREAFFDGLLFTDGWIFSKKRQGKLGYFSESRRLIEDVQHLLLSFGIVSRIVRGANKRKFGCILNPRGDIDRFFEQFSGASRESRKLLSTPDVIWEKIVSIDAAGFGDYYTPTVPLHHNYLCAGLYHRNSGKDAISVMIACYVVYILLHLRDPFHFLYGASVKGEPIDIIIVAPRGRTSQKVTFEKLKQRVKHWTWLRKRYRYKESGRVINGRSRAETDDNTVEVGGEAIVFPHNIRVFALNSSNESAEGFNIITFICTEFAAFVNTDDRPNADKIYNVLKTSANTRFPGKYLGILISYPRYRGDAIMQKYEESLSSPRMYGIKSPTWEFNPMRKKEEYIEELESDDPNIREEAHAKYLCEPGERESKFVSDKDRVMACISGRTPICDIEFYDETVNQLRLIRAKIAKFNIPRQPDSRKYVARVDLGRSRDRSALCVGHLENSVVVIDLLVHWIPDRIRRFEADVDDPARIILELKTRLINLTYVSYDQWNSQSSINLLNRRNIVSDRLPLGAREYDLMLSALNTRAVSLLKFPELTDPKKGELFHLIRSKVTGKVDHEEGYHNDLTEAVCGVIAMLKGTKKNVEDIPAGLENVKPNLHEVGNNLWSDPIDTMPQEAMLDNEDDDIFPGEGFVAKLK